MSDATWAAVRDAIQAHVNDEWGDSRILTDWVVMAASFGIEPNLTSYDYIVSDDTPKHNVMGLCHMLVDTYGHRDLGDIQ